MKRFVHQLPLTFERIIEREFDPATGKEKPYWKIVVLLPRDGRISGLYAGKMVKVTIDSRSTKRPDETAY